ncbi:MAG: DUF3500 domain-containing protein [Candidatus Limnocylindria bacterium]
MHASPDSLFPSLGRRAFLTGAGALAGCWLARGLGVPRQAAGGGSQAAFPELLRAFAASLTPRQRELLVLPADHPSRQIANTISVLERPHLGTLLSPAQRALALGLCGSMLSEQGREAFAGTLAVEGRIDGCVLALYGEPESGRAQAVLMGGHVMLRAGGESAETAVFGGGLAYGHQVGNHRWRVAGNSFAPHGDAANRLYASLTPVERARAVLPAPPHELVLQVQRAGARFDGARVGSLSEPAQEAAARVLDAVLASYPEDARARAIASIDGNGGREALHVAFYATHGFYSDLQPWSKLAPAERARRGDPYWQVWRIEGPGTILHFQGYPHVHAYLQVVRDPARANLGETLGATDRGVEGERLRRVLEGAMRRATGQSLAFHADPVPGRFCPGEITTGLAYSLDPYRNHVGVASIEGRAMSAALRERLAAAGVAAVPERSYRVATLEYFAATPEIFGESEDFERSDLLLRDALVTHLRAGGLADAAA